MPAALPPNAVPLLPVLQQEVSQYWPGLRWPVLMAAQVDQETCYSNTHPGCWNPKTELKTAREYGFGLGQITITAQFNNFLAARKLDVSLADWSYDDRYNARFQLRTLVLMNKQNYKLVGEQATDADRMAMTLAAYNGGLGGLYSDVRVCKGTKDCDPTRWWGNVELTSLKNKIPAPGYGETFFTTNHCYPYRIIYVRRAKYLGSVVDNLALYPTNANPLNCR